VSASTQHFSHPHLRRLLDSRFTPPQAERCEVCASALESDHRHLVEVMTGRVLCSCQGCWFLFEHAGADGRLRPVPNRVSSIQHVRVTAEQWDALQVPIALVFFRSSSATGCVTAFYPSPAGATESTLPLEAWAAIVESNPALRTVVPDVEAVLVRGVDHDRAWYVVPIDACYELIGRLRRRWEGFSGGDAVRTEIDLFFATLDARSAPRIVSGGLG
jgi:hypothetical protein